MILKDFPYITTNRLVKYAKLVTKAIASFNRNYALTTGTIAHDPSNGVPPNEDLLEYWEETSEYITFGRYLLFTPKKKDKEENKKEVIPFWTGISSTHTETIFCIWFKKDDILQYTGKLEGKFPIDTQKSNGEIWTSVKSPGFDKFCSSKSCAHCRRQIVKEFWRSVLEVLIK